MLKDLFRCCEERDLFQFPRSIFVAINQVTNSKQAQLEYYDAVIEYGLFGTVPKWKGEKMAMFTLMMDLIDVYTSLKEEEDENNA